MTGGRPRSQPLIIVATVIVCAALTVIGLMLFAGGSSSNSKSEATVTQTPRAGALPPVSPPASTTRAPAQPSSPTIEDEGTVGTAGTATAAAPPAAKAPVTVAKMIGQKIMVGFRNLATPPASLLAAVRSGRVGGVILFGENNGAGKGYSYVVKQLRDAARAGHNPRLLIAIDQEGGIVRRIADGPPVSSPRQMGADGSALAQGRATGEDLHRRGINVNLAPVADVPSSASSFLSTRAFGTTPALVSSAATAFARGVQEGGVAATAKHYPGLGTTGAHNTDTEVVRVDTPLAELSTRAKPFHALADAGVQLIMVSNAIYTAMDPTTPAVLSAKVGSRLRSFFPTGVVITDALNVPALKPYGSRVPVLASKAGVDVLLYVETNADAAFAALSAAVRDGTLSKRRLTDSYNRILALKSWIASRAHG